MQFWRFGWLSHYTMLSIYGPCTRQFKIGSWLRFFFAKDRMAPEANRFNSFLRMLQKCNFIRKKNKQTKKLQEPAWKFIEKHMKIHGTKVPSPATKEDKCSFFMITKPFAESLACDNLYFITKCDGLLLQSATAFLLQSATGISKCDDYYKVRQNSPSLLSVLRPLKPWVSN